MKFLVEILHPAQVHLFRNTISILEERGHEVIVTSRQKEMTVELLDELGIQHTVLSKKQQGLTGMFAELLVRNWRLWKIARRERPDAMLALTGVAMGPIGKVCGIPTVLVDEAEFAYLQRLLSVPLATAVVVGTGYLKPIQRNFIQYHGIWVQAYLAKKYFRPSQEVADHFAHGSGRPTVFVRLVDQSSNHDLGAKNESDDTLRRSLESLQAVASVVVSSEAPLPRDLQHLKMKTPKAFVHSLLAHCSAVVSNSPTMAAEAACLGVPSIYFGRLQWGYVRALTEHFKAMDQVASLNEAVVRAVEVVRGGEKQGVEHPLDDTDDIPALLADVLVGLVHHGGSVSRLKQALGR